MQRSTSSLLRRRLPSRRRRGMTLVEIMVVIAILGTVMAILAVNIVSQFDESNVEATKLQMRQVGRTLDMYAAKHKGKYPTTAEGLEAAAKYFPDGKVPTDAWGNPFQYFSPGIHSDRPYELVSLGKDGAEGGEGADADIKSWELE